jgi:4-carboxymuconolactone decarboxylase
MWFGKGISKEGLDAKTRLLLTIAGMTMQGAQAETPFRMTVRHATEAGATKDEIAETIAQMSMFAGIPAMTRAMELAREVMEDDKKDDET